MEIKSDHKFTDENGEHEMTLNGIVKQIRDSGKKIMGLYAEANSDEAKSKIPDNMARVEKLNDETSHDVTFFNTMHEEYTAVHSSTPSLSSRRQWQTVEQASEMQNMR